MSFLFFVILTLTVLSTNATGDTRDIQKPFILRVCEEVCLNTGQCKSVLNRKQELNCYSTNTSGSSPSWSLHAPRDEKNRQSKDDVIPKSNELVITMVLDLCQRLWPTPRQSDVDVCPEAPPIGNGSLVNSTGRHEGATAMYKCNAEFSTCNRSTISTCIVSGQWSPAIFCAPAKKHFRDKTQIKIYRSCDWGYGSSLTVITTIKSAFTKFYLDIHDTSHDVVMRSAFKGFVKALELSTVIRKKKEKPKRLRLVSELLAGKRLNFTLQLTNKDYLVFVGGKRRCRFKHRKKGLPYYFNFYGEWRIQTLTFHV